MQVSQDRYNYLEKYKQTLDPKEDKKKLIAIANEQDDLNYYMNLYGSYGGFTKPKSGKKISLSRLRSIEKKPQFKTISVPKVSLGGQSGTANRFAKLQLQTPRKTGNPIGRKRGGVSAQNSSLYR